MLPGLLHRPAVLLHLHHLDKTQEVLLRLTSFISSRGHTFLSEQVFMWNSSSGAGTWCEALKGQTFRSEPAWFLRHFTRWNWGKEYCTSGVRGNESWSQDVKRKRECARPEYVPQWFGVKGCRGRWWFSPSQGQAFSPLQLTGRYISENLWRDNFRWQRFLE